MNVRNTSIRRWYTDGLFDRIATNMTREACAQNSGSASNPEPALKMQPMASVSFCFSSASFCFIQTPGHPHYHFSSLIFNWNMINALACQKTTAFLPMVMLFLSSVALQQAPVLNLRRLYVKVRVSKKKEVTQTS